jgi:Emfourin
VADDRIHLQLVQSGGLAGLTLVAEVDVDDLPADAAAVVRRALDTVDLPALAARPPPPPAGPDRFSYDLTVEAAGEHQQVKLQEPEVPPELRPLLSALLPLARPQRRG